VGECSPIQRYGRSRKRACQRLHLQASKLERQWHSTGVTAFGLVFKPFEFDSLRTELGSLRGKATLSDESESFCNNSNQQQEVEAKKGNSRKAPLYAGAFFTLWLVLGEPRVSKTPLCCGEAKARTL